VAFFVDIQSDVLMIALHELASWLYGFVPMHSANRTGSTRFTPGNPRNTGGKLFPFEARTPAAFLFTQPLCLG
jgi:hypothetical protein